MVKIGCNRARFVIYTVIFVRSDFNNASKFENFGGIISPATIKPQMLAIGDVVRSRLYLRWLT